jgi:hypothetical protein
MSMTAVSFGSHTLYGEGVGGGVDILAGAREVRQLSNCGETQALEPVADEILDCFDVVAGDRLALGQPVDLALAELLVQSAQPGFIGPA